MIAEVIVDISGSEVDRVFDYAVADVKNVQKGSRVAVPFGKREIEGYVTDLKENTEVAEDKLKCIVKTLDDYPVITEEMFELMAFMRRKYHLRIVDVFRLFIPSQMRGGRIKELKKQYITLREKFVGMDLDEYVKPSAKAQRDVCLFLRENGTSSLSEMNENFSASAIRNLIAREVLEVSAREIRRAPYKDVSENAAKSHTLTPQQQAALDAVTSEKNDTFLLHGVTGSGKTEVYMRCISQALKEGRSAIMLVPEISLTPQVFKSFKARFGDNVAILHSGLSAGERFDEWRRLISGEASVAIGARSAIFAPIKNVGIIIIDEEHDSSYTSESNPRYRTYEVARFRADYNKCNLVMGSATPSIESYYRAQKGEYKLVEMPQRVNKRSLPHIDIVNMSAEFAAGNNGIFSRRLESELYECVEGGNQAIIFLNRRGYSSYVMCRSCGYVAKCERCDVSLVYHKEENVLKCHYCGNRYSSLDVCPNCKSVHIKRGYVGTQQVVERLRQMFPDKEILRMDNDTTQTKDSHATILQRFASSKASILVGTQMIAKGHDFPDVTLVGIVDADMSLHFNDYRSTERTFQLITQVSGRAGRDSKPGKVVLQTFTPNHYVYRYAVNGDYKGFYEKEINLREITKYPPFALIARILVTSESEDDCFSVLKKIYDDVMEYVNRHKEDFAYAAAMKSPVKRIQSKYRMQMLARIINGGEAALDKIYEATDKYRNGRTVCFVEVNPNNLS